MRRTLVFGAIYIVVFEGIFGSIDFVIREATVIYYVRVLAVRWLDLPGADWSIDPSTAVSASTCVIVLLGITAAFAALGAITFAAASSASRRRRGTEPGCSGWPTVPVAPRSPGRRFSGADKRVSQSLPDSVARVLGLLDRVLEPPPSRNARGGMSIGQLRPAERVVRIGSPRDETSECQAGEGDGSSDRSVGLAKIRRKPRMSAGEQGSGGRIAVGAGRADGDRPLSPRVMPSRGMRARGGAGADGASPSREPLTE